MFRSASLFIGTSFTVAVFTIFTTSNADLIVGIPSQNIFNANNFNPHKKPISLLNVPICTQSMQRTWWPEVGTIIVTGPYSKCRNTKLSYWIFALQVGSNIIFGYKACYNQYSFLSMDNLAWLIASNRLLSVCFVRHMEWAKNQKESLLLYSAPGPFV